MSLTKQDVRRAFAKLKGAPEKEAYLKAQGMTYTHDGLQRLIIWCSDGILEMQPVYRAKK